MSFLKTIITLIYLYYSIYPLFFECPKLAEWGKCVNFFYLLQSFFAMEKVSNSKHYVMISAYWILCNVNLIAKKAKIRSLQNLQAIQHVHIILIILNTIYFIAEKKTLSFTDATLIKGHFGFLFIMIIYSRSFHKYWYLPSCSASTELASLSKKSAASTALSGLSTTIKPRNKIKRGFIDILQLHSFIVKKICWFFKIL